MKLLKDFNKKERYIIWGDRKEIFDSLKQLLVVGWFFEFENDFSALYIEDSFLIIIT